MSFSSRQELRRLGGFSVNTNRMTDEQFRAAVLAILLQMATSVADIEEKLEELR